MTYVKLAAPNDRNGNPRRLILELGPDQAIEKIVDLGYGNHREESTALQVNVSASEYNAWKSIGVSRGVFEAAS